MPSSEKALCDTGPLVALFGTGQYAEAECGNALKDFRGILVTTLPVLTEAFRFLDRPLERELLWQFILGGAVRLADILPDDLPRLRSLMERYADLPMKLADASLVVVGERLKLRTIFTLDRRDFQLYRPRHVRSFEVFPRCCSGAPLAPTSGPLQGRLRPALQKEGDACVAPTCDTRR